MEKNKEDHLPVSRLKKRGWTNSMIVRFLGEPDLEKPNPRYASGHPMKLYKIQRIEEAEASFEFQDEKKRSERRRRAARKAVETKKAKIARYVEEITIEVPKLEMNELIRRACEHYNNRASGSDRSASLRASTEFLDRICVNYLRHCLTKYENHLDEIAGKVGASDAYVEIKTKVLTAIAEAYPQLFIECSLQEDRIWKNTLLTFP